MVTDAPGRVLYVDDEPTLLYLMTRALGKLGIPTQGVANAEEGLAAFKREPEAFALILTDFSMPGGMSGLEFAQAVLAVRPDAPVVIASGCIDPADARRAADLGVRKVMHKPSTVREMAALVSALVRDVGS